MYIVNSHELFGVDQMLALRLRPSQKDEYRKYWNMYHHFLGYGLLVIIIMNIFKGIHILQAGNGWKWAYIGILTILGAIVLGLEIVTWAKFCYDKQKQKETFKWTMMIGRKTTINEQVEANYSHKTNHLLFSFWSIYISMR